MLVLSNASGEAAFKMQNSCWSRRHSSCVLTITGTKRTLSRARLFEKTTRSVPIARLKSTDASRRIFNLMDKHLSASFRVTNRVAHCFVRFYAAARAARFSIYGNRIALSASVICRPLSIFQWCALKRRRAERPGLCLRVCAFL